jgi:hypothetical protein
MSFDAFRLRRFIFSGARCERSVAGLQINGVLCQFIHNALDSLNSCLKLTYLCVSRFCRSSLSQYGHRFEGVSF